MKEKDFSKLEKKLQVKFNNQDLLIQSVVHRSYLNEHSDFHLDHNERLEFLGDAVLELSVTDYLFSKYNNPEGELTNWRASLVNSKMLAQIAEKLGIEKYLFLSKGEAKDANSKARSYILANAVEAIIGAIYLDQGYEASDDLIKRILLPQLPGILKNKLYLDPKSKFQEIAQERTGATPVYKVLEETGPDHARHFVIGAYLKDELIGQGEGMSKQEAQESAAEDSLIKKGW